MYCPAILVSLVNCFQHTNVVDIKSDPAEFADIVNNIKAGMTATITTASSQAESLAEVPVPTTLITAEMIQNSGARSLQEVLVYFLLPS